LVKNHESQFTTDLHENMHGYIALRSLYFIEQTQKYQRARFSVLKGKIAPDFNTEEYLAASVLNEGISEWSSLYATKKHLEQLKTEGKDLQGFIRENIIANYDGRKLEIDFDKLASPHKEHQQLLEQAARIKAVMGKKGERLHRYTTLLVNENKDCHYGVGLYLVHQAEQALSKEGKSTSQIVDMLIDNPPTTLAEVINPQEYIQNKLGQAA